jgi:hypothetical protein
MGRWWPRRKHDADSEKPGGSRVGDGTAAGGRTVVIHYHFFKNAGTSVDATLKENFGRGWVQRERDFPVRFLSDEVGQTIASDPAIVVLSSHTAQLPPPDVPGIRIVPILFIRHPLDRLRSIYEFERRQEDGHGGAEMAKESDMATYLDWRLEHGGGKDATARSFQAHRLAGLGTSLTERRARALERLDSLPFVGLVEEFRTSIQRLQDLLVQSFPGVHLQPVWENASERTVTLDERLERFRQTIPDDLYQRLVAANADDLAVWEHVVERYRAPKGDGAPQLVTAAVSDSAF